MITNYRNRVRFSMVFAAALAVVGVVGLTDARGGERRMMRQLDPAAMETEEKMRQHVSLDLTDASLSDLLTAVANKTGVAVLQSPGTTTSNVQQARFTLHADNVPAMDLLVMALGPFRILPKPDATGLTVYKMVAPSGDGEGIQRKKRFLEQQLEQKQLEQKQAAEGAEGGMMIRRQAPNGEGPGAEEGRMKIRVRSADGSDGVEGVVTRDGTIHRDLTFSMEEKGVPSEGRLVLDIKNVKAD